MLVNLDSGEFILKVHNGIDMKLLVITQKVNKHDPLLGFFHEWIISFSKHYESVKVICLQKGEYDLPKNVEVFSLGKEKSVSKFIYLLRFFKYITRSRNEYDSVFVHMNEEYVLLGGIFWRLWGKRIVMWRNHKSGSWKTKLAVLISHIVLCTSTSSYTAKFKKTKIMPVGIDLATFTPLPEISRDIPLLYVGRIGTIKNIDFLIRALGEFRNNHAVVPMLYLVGPAESDHEIQYKNSLLDLAGRLQVVDALVWVGKVEPKNLPAFYRRAQITVNLTASGSFDKTIIESIACGSLPLIANKSVAASLPEGTNIVYSENAQDAALLSEDIRKLLTLSEIERADLHQKFNTYTQSHSLETLMKKLETII